MGIGTTIGLSIILLHLIVGFGYMIYMLAPRKGDKNQEGDSSQDQVRTY